MPTEDERPECLGWHAADPVCDGGAEEPACEWRGRCIRVAAVVGLDRGESPDDTRTEDVVDAFLEGATAEAIEALPVPAWEGAPAPVPEPEVAEPLAAPTTPRDSTGRPIRAVTPDLAPLPAVNAKVDGLVRTASILHPRPNARYGSQLELLDVFVDVFVKKTKKTLRREGDRDTAPGDLFLRYAGGMGGRMVALYAATDRGTRQHRLVTRFMLLNRNVRFNLKTNIHEENYRKALEQSPPRGPQCRVWVDMKPHVALVGVDAHACVNAAKWLARCWDADLVDGFFARRTTD